jgi:hypothetical protein
MRIVFAPAAADEAGASLAPAALLAGAVVLAPEQADSARDATSAAAVRTRGVDATVPSSSGLRGEPRDRLGRRGPRSREGTIYSTEYRVNLLFGAGRRLTIAMQALRMTAWGRDASWEEAVRPAADATGIVVRVAASGLCRSDLHFMGNVRRGWRLPYTIGHEVTGWIEEIGADVEDWDIGTPVAIFGAWGCGECSPCTTSREVICRRRRDLDYLGLGLGRDGGMASYVLVPAARLLVALPRGLDPVAAAPLCDAGLTAFHAVDQARHLLAAPARALVIGCGGIGLMVIQVLVARTSAAVIGADIAAEKLDAAREAGAQSGSRTHGARSGPTASTL